MSTRFVRKVLATAEIVDLPENAGVGVFNGALSVHDGTAVRRIIDEGDITVANLLIAVAAANAGVGASGVVGVAAGYKVARGEHVQVAASDTVVTGLTTVVAVVCSPRTRTVKQLFFDASPGDQAGTPAAGSILITSEKPTAVDNVTPTASTDFTDNIKVNWIAVGT